MSHADALSTAAGAQGSAPSTSAQDEDLGKIPISKIAGRLTAGQLYGVLASIVGLIIGSFSLGYYVRDFADEYPQCMQLDARVCQRSSVGA